VTHRVTVVYHNCWLPHRHEHVDTFRLIGESTVALTAPSLSTAYPRTNPTVRFWRHTLPVASGAALGAADAGADGEGAASRTGSGREGPVMNHAQGGSGAAGGAQVVDYDQYFMDLLASNAKHASSTPVTQGSNGRCPLLLSALPRAHPTWDRSTCAWRR